MNTFVFNTTIAVPASLPAKFSMKAITPAEANYEMSRGFTSAIGHDAAADALTELLGEPIPVNRIQAAFEPGDKAICFKLRGRVEEGVVLDRAGVEAIGYDLVLMERIS